MKYSLVDSIAILCIIQYDVMDWTEQVPNGLK